MKRRTFIKGLGTLGASAVSVPYIQARGKTFQWQMVTSWPKGIPLLHSGAEMFSRMVRHMSHGQLNIRVHAAGDLFKAFDVFDVVSKGRVECGHSTAYYWSDKVPAAPWFTAVPFGLKAMDMNTWYYQAGGETLFQEVFGEYDLIPVLAGNSGGQMGGWFNQEIMHIKDYSGLKIRIPGIGGEVLSRLDARVFSLPGSDILKALKVGMINAAEWVGPYHDTLMGFPSVAKYYYAPGWHEPGSALSLFFNRKCYEELTSELKCILKTAACYLNQFLLSAFEYENQKALILLARERKVQLRLFPRNVLQVLSRISNDVLREIAEKDKKAMKVHQAYEKFKDDMQQFSLLRGADIRT